MNYTDLQNTKAELIKFQEMINKLLSSDIFNYDDYKDEQNEKIVVYSTTANTFDMLRASLKSLFYNEESHYSLKNLSFKNV